MLFVWKMNYNQIAHCATVHDVAILQRRRGDDGDGMLCYAVGGGGGKLVA